jgi:hypothetical protein
VTETELQTFITDLARMTGWKTMHVRRSIGKGHRWTTATSCDGWPDLLLWRETLIAAELKTDRGKPTSEQIEVLQSLERAGIECHIWRPADIEAIARRLNRHARIA